jgi:hypothetical protein
MVQRRFRIARNMFGQVQTGTIMPARPRYHGHPHAFGRRAEKRVNRVQQSVGHCIALGRPVQGQNRDLAPYVHQQIRHLRSIWLCSITI